MTYPIHDVTRREAAKLAAACGGRRNAMVQLALILGGAAAAYDHSRVMEAAYYLVARGAAPDVTEALWCLDQAFAAGAA